MISKLRAEGYQVQTSEEDTTNLVCRRGHIYEDRKSLVAALDNGTPSECRALKKLGTIVADGDFGEMSVRFHPAQFRAVARILKPRVAGAVQAA